MKNFSKAYDYWQHGKLLKAIHVYQKIAERHREQHDAALYLAACVWIILAKKAYDEMGVLGVDLSQPYEDYYCKAADCLAEITNTEFEPTILDLPTLEAHNKSEIMQAYEQENASLVDIKKFNYKNYVRTFLAWVRDTSHRFAHI